ncbi:hypothetical protein AVEN_272548-1 [Araneus ventricosus]|uniref:Uncharacterized protein n=1 Tax=Araneus ventricosus TaxID=182803 RepID=A0A4Y2E8Q9_ARAVE|nr:hypothetical protein AVEN_272548-1 [Araneus ventricosus]
MTGHLSMEQAEEYQESTMFGMSNKSNPLLVAFLLSFFYNFFVLFLPLSVSLLYIYICVNLQRMFQHLTKNLQKSHSEETIELAFQKAIQLFLVVTETEDYLSVCMFFVISLNVALMFTSFAYSLGYFEMNSSATANVLGCVFINQISFLRVIWTASKVKNEINSLKTTIQTVILRKKTGMVFLLLKIGIFDSASLTAWKMFEFSRGLILSTYGMIFAYGLLILQTEKVTHQPILNATGS